jgi:glucokinase
MLAADKHQVASHTSPPAIIGVDVGGTKILASVVDKRGNLIGRVSHPTDIVSPEATLESIAQTVEYAIHASGYSSQQVQAVGLGIPGLVDPVQGIGIASVNLNWQNVPVRAILQERLGLPCAIENDVKVAALGESRFGAGKGHENLIYLSIGTGIAAAAIIENELYRGLSGMAGEIGHAILDRDGPLCKCGGRGCFEALASGPAIASRATQKLHAGGSSSLSLVNGPLTSEDVFKAAAQADTLALEIASETGEYVAQAIQFLALAYDLPLVVLGGGVPLAGQPFLDPVTHSLERLAGQNWVFSKIYSPGFLQITRLGRDIGILGAAALVTPALKATEP